MHTEAPVRRTEIIVRKYGNRRLYDTSASRYINLDELGQLIRNGNDVRVVDAKTGEDLTRVTLTQIIVEDAKDQQAGLPLEFLRELVIASNKVAREGFMWFKPALTAFEGALESSLRKAGSTALSPLEMVKNLVSTPSEERASSELDELRKRVEELEARKQRRGKKTKRKSTTSRRSRVQR